MADFAKEGEYSGYGESSFRLTKTQLFLIFMLLTAIVIIFVLYNISKVPEESLDVNDNELNTENAESENSYIDVSILDRDPVFIRFSGENVSICNNYQGSYGRASCKIGIYSNLGDIDSCDKGLTKEEKDAVFVFSSTKTNDVFNVTAEDFCIMRLSLGEKNYCDRIEGKMERELCNYRRNRK